MDTANFMRRMTKAGATPEAIAIAMEALQEVAADRRTKDAERQRKYRKLSRDKRDTSRDTGEQITSPSVNGHAHPTTALKNGTEAGVTPNNQGSLSLSLSSSVDRPTEIQQKKEEQVEARDTVQFGQFYDLYPNKVGKQAARKAFKKVVPRIVSFDVLMAGLARYVAKTDDRPWCNPATWLNQHRWEDQPATGPPRRMKGQPNTAKERTFNALEQLYRPGSNGHRTSPPNGETVSGLLPDDRSG